MDDKMMVRVSKMMSYVLRHGAEKLDLELRPDGFIPVTQLLSLSEFKRQKISLNDIYQVVVQNDKQRFELVEENGISLIRAVQGHSIKIIDSEQLLQRLTENDLASIPVIVHGTSYDAWQSIKKDGLSRMGRVHIHFARGYPSDGVISGIRSCSQVFIELDTAAALSDGMLLYEAKNGVILTSGFNGVIPIKYFKAVYNVDKKSLL